MAKSSKGATATKLLLALCLLTTSCQRTECTLKPRISLTTMPHHIGNLPHAFPPLTPEEKKSDWGKELAMGNVFAADMDLYRAITCYKRGLILIPKENMERKLELEYNIVQSYFLANKYQETVNSFEESDLRYIPPSFPPFRDLLVMMYDAYLKVGDEEKAQSIYTVLEAQAPETAGKLSLFEAIESRNIPEIKKHPEADGFLQTYCHCYKSPGKARALNAMLPGLGYAYVGQKQSAWTSFAINTLFITAAACFFHQGNYAAGIITSSLEFGWYAGGINGAGIEAEAYNRAIYETTAKQYLYTEKLFPILMFETTF